MEYLTSLSAYAEYILIGSIASIVIGLRIRKNLWKNLFSMTGILGSLLALSMLFSGGGFLPGGGGSGSGEGTAEAALTASRGNEAQDTQTQSEAPAADAVSGDTDSDPESDTDSVDHVSDEAAAPVPDGTIRIRVTKETVYFDEQQADDAEELRSLLDETYSDGKQIILQDDYADAVTYDWAKETLDEFAAEYYETILK